MTGSKAISRIDRLLAEVPLRGLRRRALQRIAAVFLSEQRFVEADAVLKRALASEPKHPDLLFSYALSANDRGLFEIALSRWRDALEVAPFSAMCWCGVAANLRSLNAIDKARATIEQALERFPDDPCLLAEAARIANRRFELEAALGYWTEAIARCVPPIEWLFCRADTLIKMRRFGDAFQATEAVRLRAGDQNGVIALEHRLEQEKLLHLDDLPTSLPAWRSGDTAIAPADLFIQFESLGDNCEFGLVQRFNHIEPLGLFRFSAAAAETLTRVVSRGFADCGIAGDLEIVLNAADKVYDCQSIGYKDFRYHTEASEWEIDVETLLRREYKKIEYLKKRLLSDMASAEKIFVRKGGSLEQIIALYRVMQVHGSISLLWVEPANEQHVAGSVERVEGGLMRGYISRFAPLADAPQVDLICWADICCNALSLCKSLGEDRPRYALQPNMVHRTGLRWGFTPLCAGSDAPEPVFPHSMTQRLVLNADTQRHDAVVAVRHIDVDLGPRACVVFSVWVWIPDSFAGTFVDVYITNTGDGFVSRADLEQRNMWQRMWCSARLPKTQTKAAVGIRVTGLKKDTLYIGAWRLENGSIPNPWPLDAARPLAREADQEQASGARDFHDGRFRTEALQVEAPH